MHPHKTQSQERWKERDSVLSEYRTVDGSCAKRARLVVEGGLRCSSGVRPRRSSRACTAAQEDIQVISVACPYLSVHMLQVCTCDGINTVLCRVALDNGDLPIQAE